MTEKTQFQKDCGFILDFYGRDGGDGEKLFDGNGWKTDRGHLKFRETYPPLPEDGYVSFIREHANYLRGEK